jgi:hypothetical protein
MEVVEVVGIGIIDVTEMEVDEELEDDDEEEVDEEELEGVEEVEDVLSVGGLLVLVLVEEDGMLDEVGFPLVETGLDVLCNGSPLMA